MIYSDMRRSAVKANIVLFSHYQQCKRKTPVVKKQSYEIQVSCVNLAFGCTGVTLMGWGEGEYVLVFIHLVSSFVYTHTCVQ